MQMNFQKIIFMGLIVMLAVNSGALSDPAAWFNNLLLIIPGIIIGLSMHEFAHAYSAYKLGDYLPKSQGRVTINPAAHIDPMGLVALAFIGFGWGKPVQINPRVFKHPRRDELIVAVSGVTMNLILAIVFTGILGVYVNFSGGFALSTMGDIIFQVIYNIIQINVVLMIFNLLPIPPLDGYSIIGDLFKLKRYNGYWKVYEYGTFILIALIFLGLTSMILIPAVQAIMSILLGFIF